MKILHITNLYPYEDASTFGIFVKEQIDSLGHPDYQDVFFINARKKGWKEYFRAARKLKTIIKGYDLVHCHHQFSAVTALFADPKKKMVVSILGDIEKRDALNKIVFSLVKRFSDKIIFKNKIPASPAKQCFLLPNGVNLSFFRQIDKETSKTILNLEFDKRYVLFVSNGSIDNPIKRLDKFKDILKILKKNDESFFPLYLSNVPREMVPYYFNAADFMVLTSDHEGSPNAVKEAMACNLPIVSTSVGDVPVLLKKVLNSSVASTGSVKELSELALNITLDQRSNGRNRLIEMGLDSESVAKRLVKVYSSLF